nr:copper homeostasis membrane protein CopD [uncultured Cupriavidus sp.]
MQVEWLNVLVRFLLYLDLMLVFGLPLFAGLSLRRGELRSPVARRLIGWTASAGIAGMVLSAIGMAVMAKAMTGAASYSELTAHVFEMMITGTAFGLAWAGRLIALTLGITAVIALRKWPHIRLPVLGITGAVALSTLAWAGHGAMDDSAGSTIHLFHLFVDIAHLLAAGAWIGALVAFVLLGRAVRAGSASSMLLARTAHDFARLGSIIVATLVATGTANYWLIAGLPSIAAARSPYGMLLLAKLGIFTTMLGMAALNRYRLVPRLAAEIHAATTYGAVRALRKSLLVELAIGLCVLLAVALLGVLSPEG